MAELKLDQLISDLESIANIRNLDVLNPIVMSLSHPTNKLVTKIVCAQKEPSTLVLPLNVTWIDLNPQSPNYRKALRRKSKDADVSTGRDQTWEIIETYADVFVTQYYDDEDAAQLTTQNPVSIASPSVLGVARLSTAAQVGSNPVVVAEGDPRLSDARTPKAHTHEEVPATQIKTASTVVTVSGSEAPEAGAVLVATSSTTALWRKLNTSDIAD